MQCNTLQIVHFMQCNTLQIVHFMQCNSNVTLYKSYTSCNVTLYKSYTRYNIQVSKHINKYIDIRRTIAFTIYIATPIGEIIFRFFVWSVCSRKHADENSRNRMLRGFRDSEDGTWWPSNECKQGSSNNNIIIICRWGLIRGLIQFTRVLQRFIRKSHNRHL